ncbi:MAG: ATP-binding protein [Deltaproteobacteria bacterium]|nr:ATP-binding protein [Deltaproteobacteria bacterium]
MHRLAADALHQHLQRKSVFLLGPRRTGKSFLLRHQCRADRAYDLLQSDVYQRLAARPWLLREDLGPNDRLVVVDEIQKIPALLDEVHGLIESRDIRFVLSGSSARKLRRAQVPTLAGRARLLAMFPLVRAEIAEFDLDRALRFGLLPPVWLADDPWDELKSYAGEYLHEEIRAEALARRIEGFARFLRSAALTHGELVNFESVGRDSGVPARTVREYYQVLVDTLLGDLVEPWQVPVRKAVSHGKFYFFDNGVVHALLGARDLPEGTVAYGTAFEAWVHHELRAWLARSGSDLPLRFWRTADGAEVDFVLGDGSVAIEVKATKAAETRDARGLRALAEATPLGRQVLVSRDPSRRRIGPVEVWPAAEFALAVAAGEFGG